MSKKQEFLLLAQTELLARLLGSGREGLIAQVMAELMCIPDSFFYEGLRPENMYQLINEYIDYATQIGDPASPGDGLPCPSWFAEGWVSYEW